MYRKWPILVVGRGGLEPHDPLIKSDQGSISSETHDDLNSDDSESEG
jgi:hypothetical protein